MEIILLERIQNLGDLGDQVNVKPGYARNFLIPQKKAMRATDDAKSRVDERRRELAKMEAERLDVAKARADIAVKSITVIRKSAEEGHLYGSVTPADIAEGLEQQGTEVQRSEILMPGGPIKELGDYEINIQLHPEVQIAVTVAVIEEQE